MHFCVGRVYETDGFVRAVIQERRTKENAHVKDPEDLKYEFFYDEVTFVNCTFDSLKEGDIVLFSLTHFDGKKVVDTIEVPRYDD
jgi:hypothetical protein